MKNKGFSLVELLIASSIGLIAIGIVGSVFLSGYTSANQRSLELLLKQDVNDALSLLKEDILRAGYNKDKNTSYIVSGATEIVTIDTSKPTKHCISYAYHDGTVQHLRSFYTKMGEDSEDNDVRVLRLYSTTNPVRDSDDFCDDGESILDQNVIEVNDFTLRSEALSSGSATSRLITITLAANLIANPSISIAKSVQVKTRNWQ
ncbi:prepilin-type N-terminal cleavage/methylation domain-containing protein [Photobacterium damselae]